MICKVFALNDAKNLVIFLIEVSTESNDFH